ncbi:MAG: hypothetical protein QF473_08920 [Planctomycetota bacterium]|jgi:hypothetical protein|nr:hypothetical protein [Planctomycetota bacterium]
MKRSKYLRLLILVSILCTLAVQGEEPKREFEFWDHHAAGIIYLIDDKPEDALNQFSSAGNVQFGPKVFEAELLRISRKSKPDGHPATPVDCLKNCAHEPMILSRYFLAKALTDAKKSDDSEREVLGQLLALSLKRAPWKLPDDLVMSLRLLRARLSDRSEDPTVKISDHALNDYRSLMGWIPTTAIHEFPGIWLSKIALAAYQLRDFPGAHSLYSQYRKEYPYSPLGDMAILGMARSLVMMRDSSSASPLFKQAELEFPLSKHIARYRYVEKKVTRD